jgi:hypothetical protein
MNEDRVWSGNEGTVCYVLKIKSRRYFSFTVQNNLIPKLSEGVSKWIVQLQEIK